jgi:hypothetical protein
MRKQTQKKLFREKLRRIKSIAQGEQRRAHRERVKAILSGQSQSGERPRVK